MSRKTGNLNEVRCCEELVLEGFRVWMPPYPRFGKTGKFRTCDFYNTFDVIAVKGDTMRVVQVKTRKYFLKKVIQKIKDCKLPKYIIKEYWTYDKETESFRKMIID